MVGLICIYGLFIIGLIWISTYELENELKKQNNELKEEIQKIQKILQQKL